MCRRGEEIEALREHVRQARAGDGWVRISAYEAEWFAERVAELHRLQPPCQPRRAVARDDTIRAEVAERRLSRLLNDAGGVLHPCGYLATGEAQAAIEDLADTVAEIESGWPNGDPGHDAEIAHAADVEAPAPAPGDRFADGVQAYTGWFQRARQNYPEAIFRPDGVSPDAYSARAIRWVIDEWTERAERELLGNSAVVREPLPLSVEVADACVDLSEVLDALTHGAEISPADMRALARCPLAVVASVGARAGVHPTTAAAFWLLAQTQTGTVARDESWAWHPTNDASRTLVLRIDAEDGGD